MYRCSFKGFYVDFYSNHTNTQTSTNIDIDSVLLYRSTRKKYNKEQKKQKQKKQ